MAGTGISRRHIVIAGLLGSTALLATRTYARTIPKEIPWLPGQVAEPTPYPGARFFTVSERRCVDAITARLIPSDEAGPGAREAGVVDFIDSQLAGFWGRGERWYMRGPFPKDYTEQQGYQAAFTPAALYRSAIGALDAHCRTQFDDKVFAELDAAEQDAILKRMDEGELELDGVPAGAFFSMVHENTIEGFFCDPIYGGNRDMAGWRLVGFPGARYDYRDFLNHNGAAISLEPVGLRGRPAWNAN